MNVVNLLTFLCGSVFGDLSSIWQPGQLAKFGDEVPLDTLYDQLRAFLEWIVAGSELDLTKSPLATLAPGCLRLFSGDSRSERSAMARLAFDFLQDLLPPSSSARWFSSRDLTDLLMLRERIFPCQEVGNSHSGFGPVREVRIDQSGKRFAGKYFTDSKGSEWKQQDCRSQMLYLSGLTHRCLAPIVKFCDPEPGHGPVVVTPFYSNGSLTSFVSGRTLTWTDKALLVGEIACGLAFVHSEEIVHECLRPSKFLIDDDCHVHLNGFATSQLVRLGILTFEKIGDTTYAAPECFASDWSGLPFGRRSKCDIYSLGLILCELIFDVAFSLQCTPADWLRDAQKADAPVAVEAGSDGSEAAESKPEMTPDSDDGSAGGGRRAAVLAEGPRAPGELKETVPVASPIVEPAPLALPSVVDDSGWHFPLGMNVELGRLILRCCSDNPDERPTIAEFLVVLSRHRCCFTRDVDCDSVMKALADLDVTGCIGLYLSAPLADCDFFEEKPPSEPARSEEFVEPNPPAVEAKAGNATSPPATDYAAPELVSLGEDDYSVVRDLGSWDYGTASLVRVGLCAGDQLFVRHFYHPGVFQDRSLATFESVRARFAEVDSPFLAEVHRW
jgi:serine/threonine protein kinase